jgi:hypothetical protein
MVKRFVMEKHANLFAWSICDEENKFYSIDTRHDGGLHL